MKILPTRTGLRFSAHGVVISELCTRPGPTHSVFDVLAALIAVLRPAGRVGVLGFAGGGMMAPLHALGVKARLHCVDLDRACYEIFRQHCPEWAEGIRWTHADALAWLRRQRTPFDLILEDLTIAHDGDVVKPGVTWSALPDLIPQRLVPGSGVAVCNLLLPPSGRWQPGLGDLAARFRTVRVVNFDDFENRILIGGEALPSARQLSVQLRGALGRIRSRQARRIRVERLGGC